MTTFKQLAAALTVSFASASLWAQPVWQLSVMPTRTQLTTEELTPQGAIFNQERGAIEGVQLRLGRRFGDWQIGVVRDQLDGQLLYLGRTQVGFPVITFSQYGWQAQHGFVERRFGGSGVDSFGVVVGGRLQQRRVDRLILGSAFNLPLQEVLREQSLGFDVSASFPAKAWARSATSQWGVDWATATLPMSVEVKSSRERVRTSSLDVNSFEVFDAIRLDPGRSTHRTRAWSAHWEVAPGVRVTYGAESQTLSPGESPQRIWTQNGVPASTVQYPGAVLRLKTTRVGAVFDW